MPVVKFTANLKRFFPELRPVEIAGSTVAEVVTGLDGKFKGISAYIVDEHGALRKHVNIFIRNELIYDRQKLSDTVSENDEIYIMQALSGG